MLNFVEPLGLPLSDNSMKLHALDKLSSGVLPRRTIELSVSIV